MPNKIFVADKTTLDNVNNKIDNIMNKLNSITDSSNNSDYIDSIEAKETIIDISDNISENKREVLNISYEKGGILDMYISLSGWFSSTGFNIDGKYSKIPVKDLHVISHHSGIILLSGIKFKKSVKVEAIKEEYDIYDYLTFRGTAVIKKFA